MWCRVHDYVRKWIYECICIFKVHADRALEDDATTKTTPRRGRHDEDDATTKTRRRGRNDDEDRTAPADKAKWRGGSWAGLALKSWLKRAGVKSDWVGKHISNSHYAASPHPSAWKLCVYQTHTMQLQLTTPPYRPVVWHFEGRKTIENLLDYYGVHRHEYIFWYH